ncbi:hypothetical protein JMJ35_005406 [Cladonia borealis]|uniref:DNA polymerase delta subunit 4 n=1 Tax=Cladonia borealis TaxID=184061 RepID=A0AA39V1H4_9LECA|nr:hypothetical protein JMJ35_005406 [Cladonia borealis]
MPPTRRKTSTRAQSTLAFGPNSSSNKVTKPLAPPSSTKKSPKTKPTSKKSDAALLDETSVPSTPSPAPEEEKPSLAEKTVPESPRTLAIRNQTTSLQEKSSKREEIKADGVEELARKIPETQIRKYWKNKEDERIAPRVHQGGLSINEKILRHFDLSSQYGPCIGIPRLRRWKRAEGLGLKPPIEVLAVLVREEGKGNKGAEKAFMDGLLASRLSGGD